MNFLPPSVATASRALACGLALAASTPAIVGQWTSYTDQSRVTALIEHRGYVYAGTQGGIRRISLGDLSETSYNNLSGLTDPWIAGFAVDTNGALWAAGRDGYLHLLRGERWETWGRSYASQDWKMNPRAILSAGAHLYLGSEKGLSLFAVGPKVSQLNVTRFRDELGLSVRSLLRRDDTLYVGTSEGLYKARVYFADPLNPPDGYANLADPSAWTLAFTTGNPVADSIAQANRRFDHLAFIGDSLATFGPGTLIQQPVRVAAFADTILVIGSSAYDTAWTGYTSALVAGGRVFAGGPRGLVVANNPSAGSLPVKLPSPRPYPPDSIFALGARNGQIWAQASSGLYFFDHGARGFGFQGSHVPIPSPELYYRNLRNVVVGPSSEAYIATWGKGLVRGGAVSRFWTHQTDTCLATDYPGEDFTVAASLSKPYGNGLFFSIYTSGTTTHQIAHLNLSTGTVTCPEGGREVAGQLPRGLRILSDSVLASASIAGVTFLKITPAIQGPQLSVLGHWTLPGSANEAWAVAKDKWDRPWALIGPNLAYVDSLETSTERKFKPIDNFVGRECKNLDADAAGKLWIGCANGLFHVETLVDGALGAVRRYGLDDGLLSVRLYDVAVDSGTGEVWVATDRGVSRFESASQPELPTDALPTIVPYPNPFRAHHRVVVFDKLPRNATLRVHDADGRVVRIFHPRDLVGNQAQWDGRNEQGKPVAPGVYLFSVISGSAVARGKVIVAR